MATGKLIVLGQGNFAHLRYFHTNFQMATGDTNGQVEIAKIKRGDMWPIGETAINMIRAIGDECELLGIDNIRLSSHQLSVQKHNAYPWGPLEAKILEIISRFYNNGDPIKARVARNLRTIFGRMSSSIE